MCPWCLAHSSSPPLSPTCLIPHLQKALFYAQRHSQRLFSLFLSSFRMYFSSLLDHELLKKLVHCERKNNHKMYVLKNTCRIEFDEDIYLFITKNCQQCSSFHIICQRKTTTFQCLKMHDESLKSHTL